MSRVSTTSPLNAVLHFHGLEIHLLLLALCLSRAQFPNEDLDNTVGHVVDTVFETWANAHGDKLAV
jgi:hypothetical protein